MKIVKKNVYYCDHCKKKTLQSYAMKVHEKHCTANPNRQCRLCGGGDVSDIVNEFKGRLSRITFKPVPGFGIFETSETVWADEKITLQQIRDKTDGCPNCMLAVIRQSQLNIFIDQEMFDELGKFDYKKELQEALKDRNEERSNNYNT